MSNFSEWINSGASSIEDAISMQEALSLNSMYKARHNLSLNRYDILVRNAIPDNDSSRYTLGLRLMSDSAQSLVRSDDPDGGASKYFAEVAYKKSFLLSTRPNRWIVPDYTIGGIPYVLPQDRAANPLPFVHGFTAEDLPLPVIFSRDPLSQQTGQELANGVSTVPIAWDDYARSVPLIMIDVMHQLHRIDLQAIRVLLKDPQRWISRHLIRHRGFFTLLHYYRPRQNNVQQNDQPNSPTQPDVSENVSTRIEDHDIERKIITLAHPIFFGIGGRTFRFNPRFLSALHDCFTELRDLGLSNKGSIF